jgi:hypothetical protein
VYGEEREGRYSKGDPGQRLPGHRGRPGGIYGRT